MKLEPGQVAFEPVEPVQPSIIRRAHRTTCANGVVTKAGHRVGAGTVRAIAVRASADPRTVVKVLRGEVVRGLPGDRIRRELQQLGILA
jgi:hypothetical protein